MPSKPAGKSFRVLASELNWQAQPVPTNVNLVWVALGSPSPAVTMTPDTDTMACVVAPTDPASVTTSMVFTLKATAPNGKNGSISLTFTPDPTVVVSVVLAVDPNFDP